MIALTFTIVPEMTCLRSVRSPSFSRVCFDADPAVHKINAGIVRDLATEIAETSPKAFILVISNPVNSTVPIVAEVLRQRGVFDPKRYYTIPSHELSTHKLFRLFGVTTLDVVRASTFVAEKLGNPSLAPHIQVPVIGGHSGVTVSPFVSHFRFLTPTHYVST